MTGCSACHNTGQLLDIDPDGTVIEVYLCPVCNGIDTSDKGEADTHAVHD